MAVRAPPFATVALAAHVNPARRGPARRPPHADRRHARRQDHRRGRRPDRRRPNQAAVPTSIRLKLRSRRPTLRLPTASSSFLLRWMNGHASVVEPRVSSQLINPRKTMFYRVVTNGASNASGCIGYRGRDARCMYGARRFHAGGRRVFALTHCSHMQADVRG